MNRLKLAEQLVERAAMLGADDAEAFVLDSSSVEIQVRNERPDTVQYSDVSGFGIRVLIDGRMGFASSNNLDIKRAEDVIRRVVTYTQHHTQDDHNVFPDSDFRDSIDHSLDQYDEEICRTAIEKKIELTVAMEAAAKQADDRISHVPYVQYGDSLTDYAIASSRGIRGEARRSEVYGAVMAAAMEKSSGGQFDQATVQTGVGIKVKSRYAEIDPNEVGRKAAEFAVRMLGASDGRTIETVGVFPPETGFNFVKVVADMADADVVQKKKSLFSGKSGEIVASDYVTIIDDGRLKGGLGSTAVDAEGVPSSTTTIIDKGKLIGYMHDAYTAHRGQTKSTGNAQRTSFDSKPYIAPTNFYMAPGTASRDSLIGSVSDGMFVTEVSGLHASVDTVTGDFSIPAKGIIIKSGELTTPITNITISGNIFEFFKEIDAVADDLTWEPREDVIGAPTFRVKTIKISGK
jgi:PmbA protein